MHPNRTVSICQLIKPSSTQSYKIYRYNTYAHTHSVLQNTSKTKSYPLNNLQINSLQALHSEIQTLEPAHAELVSLGTSLCPTAPEERVRHLKDELETLQKRLHVQNEVFPQR